MNILIDKIELKNKILIYLDSGDVLSLPYNYTNLISKSTKNNYKIIIL